MPVLINLNQIKAAKKMVIGLCKEYMGVKKVAPPIQGFSVNLSSVVELIEVTKVAPPVFTGID